MSSWRGDDVYNNPEDFGVEIVGSFELSDEFYQFDSVLVLKDVSSGMFYVLQDSGCSCPEPFDNFTTKESLGRLLSVHEAVTTIRNLSNDGRNGFRPNSHEVVSRVLNSGIVKRMTEQEFLTSLEDSE